MNIRRPVFYDHDNGRLVVVDIFPGQKVCARIHKLGRYDTAFIQANTLYGVPTTAPVNPYEVIR